LLFTRVNSINVTNDYVWLFGSARAALGSSRVNFAPEKRYQLLAYLAYSQDWVSRERLAYLFWPDTETHKAQQNLRQLLKRVRSLCWLSNFETNEHKVRWLIDTDVSSFRQAFEENHLDEALLLYEGPLLSGMESDEKGEFSNWLELERTHLHSLWRETLFKRVQTLQATGNDSQAASLLTKLLTQDALDEEALVTYLQTTSRAGQGQQGLRAYREFKTRLHHELGLEPTSTTQRLAETLEKSDSAILTLPQPPLTVTKPLPVSLPAPTTSFIGRELELAEIAHLLSKPECRLLTLTGPGGIGKTRLALRAAEELAPRYQDRIYFAFLDSLSTSDAIASRLAQALGFTLTGSDDPLTQVIRFIGEKHLLLVLDNFEHLLDGVSLISQMLERCPKLELLITSRERLNLAQEWLLSVAGLPYPTNSKEALTSDAVTLFLQRAQQVQPTFTAQEQDLPHLLELCRLVGGSPLAIELSAVWVRMMSVVDIARDLETSLDLLTTSLRNVPERQQSIRATFEHSWKLLTPKERESLRRLSIFRGGFTREAAAAVAGTSVAVLAALVDKSLLRVPANSRYDFHPLVYEYVEEKLAQQPEEQARTKAKHGEYSYSFVSRQEKDTFQKPEVLDVLEEEFENIRLALEWFVTAHPETLSGIFDTLFNFLDLRGRYEEATKLFAGVVAVLDETNPTHHKALGNALVNQAWFYLRLGRYEDSQRVAEQGLARVSLSEVPTTVLTGYNTLAAAAHSLGNFAESLRQREVATELIQSIKEKEYLPAYLADRVLAVNTANTAQVETSLGHYAEAERHHREALLLSQRLGNVSSCADGSTGLGSVLLFMGKLDEALLYLQEGLKLSCKIGMQDGILEAQTYLAAVYLELGEVEKALELAHELKSLVEKSELSTIKLEGILVLGRIATKCKDHVQARDYLKQGLDLAWTTRDTPKLLAVLVGFAKLHLGQGDTDKAIHLLGFVRKHPKTEYRFRTEAQELLGELEKRLSSKTMRKRLEQGKAMTLEEAVEVARGLA
jgi:predicted ATPase/DNA-binding SARP family transcriptional activator